MYSKILGRAHSRTLEPGSSVLNIFERRKKKPKLNWVFISRPLVEGGGTLPIDSQPKIKKMKNHQNPKAKPIPGDTGFSEFNIGLT